MRFLMLFAVPLTVAVSHAAAQTSVLTQDYDIARSGANLTETVLKPSSISAATFGKLFAYPVDDEVFVQPLYVPGLNIKGGTHNVVIVATMSNSVYAFDADNAATANSALWSVNLGAPVPSAKFAFRAGSGYAHNGILATPVIDPVSDTIYVVSQLWNGTTQSVTFQLNALDLLSGHQKFGGPRVIAAVGFNADVNIQRAGLLLLNAVLYVPIASHADLRANIATGKPEKYVGMILAYDAQSLAPLASFNAEPGGTGGGIWQGGRGLVSDGTHIYAATANALVTGIADHSESFMKLDPRTLSVLDMFVDPDQGCLNTLDLDLSSAGPQLLSNGGTNVLIGGGKQGKVYALQLNQSLQFQTPTWFWGTTNHALLPAEGGSCADPRADLHGWLHGSDTALWNNPSGPPYFYAFGNYDKLHSWQVSGTTFTPTSTDSASSSANSALALSANGGSDALLWTIVSLPGQGGVVTAYNATPSAGHLTKLWDSTEVTARDTLGWVGRYSVPTVANGKVYIGTGSNQVAVYGLLPILPAVQLSGRNPTLLLAALNSKTQNVYINALAGYTGTVTLTVSGLPSGMTYSFNPTTVNLTTAKPSRVSGLTISPGAAVLPLADNYTVVVRAVPANGPPAYFPFRLYARYATLQAASAGCNSLNQMSATLSWQINGSGIPSIWIQDPQTPIFPGRAWIDPAPSQTSTQTDYSITSNKQHFRYWALDQSAQIPANLDNALGEIDLGNLYDCP
jgi:hypothetical protein